MRGLSLPQLVRPWAALATPPTDDTAPAAPRRAAHQRALGAGPERRAVRRAHHLRAVA